MIHKESLCINCGACVSECNAMESDPDFLGPQALAKAMRFVGDPRDGAKLERLESVNGKNGIWQCTRCYFCNERCPKGVDPRDAIAKLGAESVKEGIDRDMGAKHAKWFVISARTTGWLRETELVPHTQGIVESIRQTRFALKLAARRQGADAVPAARGEERRRGAASCTTSSREQGRSGYAGHRPGRARAGEARPTATTSGERDLYGEGSFPRAVAAPKRRRQLDEHERDGTGSEAGRLLQGLPRLALGEGARHLDAGARARRSASSSTSSSRSPAAAPATSTRPSPTTTST